MAYCETAKFFPYTTCDKQPEIAENLCPVNDVGFDVQKSPWAEQKELPSLVETHPVYNLLSFVAQHDSH